MALDETCAVRLAHKTGDKTVSGKKSSKLQPDYRQHLGPDLLSAEQAAVFIREGALGKIMGTDRPGSSRFGGDPDMPADLDWPEWDGKPLRFMMQVRLEELPAIAGRELLPERGLLYFFYSPLGDEEIFHDEQQAGRVLFTEDLDELEQRQPPEEDEEGFVMEPEAIVFEAFNTILDPEHPFWDDAGGYDKFRDAANAARAESDEYAYGRPYQVLGHPTPMQTSVQKYVASAECAARPPASATVDEAKERITREPWELLLAAIDCIGDTSMYVMIRREDLRARQWDKAWFVLQST